MSIVLAVGDNDPLSIEGLKDLESLGSPNPLQLGKEFAAVLDVPLAGLPEGLRSTAVSCSGEAPAWLPAGPVSFTLAAGACGKVSVLTSGTMLQYTDDFPSTVALGPNAPPNPNTTAKISVPNENGEAFLCVELDFSLRGGLTGSASDGAFGLTASASGAASVSVAFYKRCDPGTTFRAALVSAFQGFVLPLHTRTVENLSPGDYLHYTFQANLQLGLGATVGIDKVLYAGQYKQDVPATATAVTLQAGIKPEVKAGAKLAFGYTYAGAFEASLWKNMRTPNVAMLHLYRSSARDTSLGVNAGLTFTAGVSATAAINQQALDALTQLLPTAPVDLQAAFTAHVLPAAYKEVGKLVDEANGKVASWLTPLNGQQCTLSAAVEHSADRFLLSEYAIDTTQSYAGAWSAMLAGRFVDAFEMAGSGVCLQVGSGTEALYRTATSIKLNLFGKLSAQWDSATVSNSSLIYAGNNTFHLITDEGREVLSLINGSKREIDVYFAAEADLTAEHPVLPEVQLHAVLQATGNPKFGGYIAGMLGLLTHGPAGQALAAAVAASTHLPGSTQVLHIILPLPQPPASFPVDASNLVHGKPDDESKDKRNFDMFQRACAQLFGPEGAPSNFTFAGKPLTYDQWRNTNIAQNDQWPASPTAQPNRTASGSSSAASVYLGTQFPGAGIELQSVYYLFAVAAQFMNLCASLKNLATVPPEVDLASWEGFVGQLKKIIENDLDKDFLAPAALALTYLWGSTPVLAVGPAQNLPVASPVSVTLRY